MSNSIAALRKQLQQVQLGKANKALSERNCIELVSKLVERGLVEVVYTQDGREYVTFERLEIEILDELEKHGGRLNIVELVSLLGVDLPSIENAMEKLVRTDEKLRLEQGILYSEEYFASVAQEVEELLQTINFATVADLSSRLELRMDLLKEILHKYLDTVIHGKIESNTVYNAGYIRELEATVFGTLKGALFPVYLRHLVKGVHLHVDWIIDKTEDWCKELRLDGFVTGNGENTLFIPRLFDERRLQIIEEHYLRNRYIDYRFLKDLYVQEPQKYCQEHFPSCLVLSSCVVHPEFLSFVESSSMEAIRNGQWLDWNMLLPPHWKEADRRTLFSQTSELKHCCVTEPSKQLKLLKGKGEDLNENDMGIVIRWRWIFSIQLIGKFYKFFYDWGMNEAQKLLKEENLLGSDEFLKSNFEAQVPKNNKKKKRGKVERDNRTSSETILDSKRSFSLEQCLNSLREHSELEEVLGFDTLGNTCEEDLLRILVEDVFSKALDKIQEDVIRSAREQLILETKTKDEKLRLELVKLLRRLYFYSSNMKRFSDQLVGDEKNDIIEQIDSHICRTLGTELVELVVTYQSFNLGLSNDGEIISSKEWKSVLEKLPPYIQESVKELQTFCRSENKQNYSEPFRLAALLQEYCDRFKNSEVPIVHSLPSKETDQLQQADFEEAKSALIEAVEAPDVLSKCLKFLLVKYFDVFLIFPGKSIPKLIKIVDARLQSSNCRELQTALSRLHEIAVNSLRTQNAKNVEERRTQSDVNSEEAISVIKKIKDMLSNNNTE